MLRTCVVCTCTFTWEPRQCRPPVTCSEDCKRARARDKARAYQRTLPPRRPKPPRTVVCRCCGSSFQTKLPETYCSSTCRATSQRARTFTRQSGTKLTPAELHELFTVAAGLCEACGEPLAAEQRQGKVPDCIDHCHETGGVRGIVHHRCNVGLGYAADSPEKLFNWQVYLARSTFDLREMIAHT